MAFTERLSGILVVHPFHFWTYKFHGRKFASQMGFASFTPHQERWIMRTAGDTVSIDSIIDPLNRKLCFQRNKSSLKTDIFKKGFVDFNGIKGSISKKSFWIDQRMFLKKINQNRAQCFRIRKRFILIRRI